MKRIVYFILCVACVFSLPSCEENPLVWESEKTIAVKYASANESAFEDYVFEGYTNVTYASSSDVILAVENKKADYGILDEFELNAYVDAGRNIKPKEKCKYSINYCAYFDFGNDKLKQMFDQAIKELNDNGTIEKIKSAHLKGERFASNKNNNLNGTLTMLCDPNFDNRVYTDDNGDIVGLDVDIAREICNYLGCDLEIVTADFDELFIELNNGAGDFIISACEVNEEREEYYLLSDTYFTLNFFLIEKE